MTLRLTAKDVAHLKAGDYLEAEFEELTRGMYEIGKPTGRTYVLRGELKEYDGYTNINEKGLAMPNGQSVRQTSGLPGGNLVRILKEVQT